MTPDWIGAAGTDTAGEFTRLLEGSSLSSFPEPPEHSHRCPECGQDWRHADEECATDGIPDHYIGGVPASGYATCGECFAPSSNGSLWRLCVRHHTRTLADPLGRPSCCGGVR